MILLRIEMDIVINCRARKHASQKVVEVVQNALRRVSCQILRQDQRNADCSRHTKKQLNVLVVSSDELRGKRVCERQIKSQTTNAVGILLLGMLHLANGYPLISGRVNRRAQGDDPVVGTIVDGNDSLRRL